MLKPLFPLYACLLAGSLMSGCNLPDMSINNNPSPLVYGFSTMRRLYVDDSASNDSLQPALKAKGVKFVLQPGETYTLRLQTAATGDVLNLHYVDANGNLQGTGSVSPQVADGEEMFTLTGNGIPGQATFFTGEIPVNDTLQRSKIRLVPVSPAESDSLSVHLFLVGNLSGLSDTAAKGIFARSFLTELQSIYATYGINMNTSYEITGPDTSVTVTFGAAFMPLPGNRIPGSAHLYLVDNISPGTVAIPAGSYILGFSPREVVNITEDPNSRLILNMRGMLASGGNYASMATTAAHELGHFFGLRHPTSTAVDLQFDNDLSNTLDGLDLDSASHCPGIPKKAAISASSLTDLEGGAYCLYIASAACPSSCDLTNLMFAYYCSGNPAVQRQLSSQQQTLIRHNLALLQGK